MTQSKPARICHICKNSVPYKQFCEYCVKAFENLPNPEDMTSQERVKEMKLWKGSLEIPFSMLHERIEALLGRSVWTHEMGLNWEDLVVEAGTREHPNIASILDLIPEEKRLVVVC